MNFHVNKIPQPVTSYRLAHKFTEINKVFSSPQQPLRFIYKSLSFKALFIQRDGARTWNDKLFDGRTENCAGFKRKIEKNALCRKSFILFNVNTLCWFKHPKDSNDKTKVYDVIHLARISSIFSFACWKCEEKKSADTNSKINKSIVQKCKIIYSYQGKMNSNHAIFVSAAFFLLWSYSFAGAKCQNKYAVIFILRSYHFYHIFVKSALFIETDFFVSPMPIHTLSDSLTLLLSQIWKIITFHLDIVCEEMMWV